MHSGISLRAGYVSRLSALARAAGAPDAAAAAAAAVVVQISLLLTVARLRVAQK